MDMLNIYFLGKSKIEYQGKGIEDQLGNKAIALICLLVLNEKRYLSRDKIVGYLWPDSSIEAARYNLRYNLWLIKKNIGEDENCNPFLRVDNDCCSINKDYEFKCDIYDIMKFKPNQKDSVDSIIKLKQLFRGDLLEGCYFNKCDEFNDLIIFERINFEQRKVKILKRLVELYEKDDNYNDSLEIINEVLEIEPYDEDMVLKILDIYVKCGKRVSAITYYNNFSNLLAGSLGISPSNKLRDKYNEIRLTLSDSYAKRETDDNDKVYSKSSFNNKNYPALKIVTDCMKNVEYFWISDVIGKLVAVIDGEYINQLSEKELLDLGYIQSDILSYCSEKENLVYEYKREVMSVCIINAFIKLLNNICQNQNLTIIILNSSDMDEVSANVLKYLRRTQIEGLNIVEESIQ